MDTHSYDDFFNEEGDTDDYQFITPALTHDPSISSSSISSSYEYKTPSNEPAAQIEEVDDPFFDDDLQIDEPEQIHHDESNQSNELEDDPFFDDEFVPEEISEEPPSPDDPDFDEKFAEWEARMAQKYQEEVVEDYEPEPVTSAPAPIKPIIVEKQSVPSIQPSQHVLPVITPPQIAPVTQAKPSIPVPSLSTSARPSIPPVAIKPVSQPTTFESTEKELNDFDGHQAYQHTPQIHSIPQSVFPEEETINYDEIRDIPPLPPFDDSSLLSYTAYLDERCLSQGFLDEAFMWHLGSLLIQTRGGLPFENFGGNTDLDGSELAANLRDLLFANTPYQGVRYESTQNWAPLSSSFFNDLETKLITSKMTEAFDFSMQTGQYHISMVLASFIGPKAFNSAVAATAVRLPQGSALRALFSAIACDGTIWEPTNDTDWRQILAVLLANRTPGSTVICQKLGDYLAHKNRIGASVVCQIIGGVPADSISLLRSNHPLFNNFRQILSHVQTLRKDAKPLQISKSVQPEIIEKPRNSSKIESVVGNIAGSLFKEPTHEKTEKVRPPDQTEEGKKGFFGKLKDVFSRDSTTAFLGDDLDTTTFTPKETYDPPPVRPSKPSSQEQENTLPLRQPVIPRPSTSSESRAPPAMLPPIGGSNGGAISVPSARASVPRPNIRARHNIMTDLQQQ